MKITHIAIWTEHLEELRDFYCNYFGGQCGEKYTNPGKRFESYHIMFEGECHLELMRRSDINGDPESDRVGLAHFAMACTDESAVDSLTERLRAESYQIVGEPRRTGEGSYGSVVADPDGNLVEITCC